MLPTLKQRCLVVFYLIAAILLACFLCFVRDTATGIPVLNYHQINDKDHNALTVPVADFEREMAYLKADGYTSITPEQLSDHLKYGKPLPEKPVMITFDDGYRDNYTNAFPILQKYGFTASIFLVSDFMGRFDNYLTWEQVQEMSEAGINMESHTLSHVELAGLPHDELYKQLMGGKLATEWKTLKFVKYMAYPCGNMDEAAMTAVKDCGYEGGFTVRYDLVHSWDDAYEMPRVPIFGNVQGSFLRFKLRLHGAALFGRLERLRAQLLQNGHTFLGNIVWLP